MAADTRFVWDDAGRTWLGAVGVLVFTTGVGSLVGPVGVGLGAAVAVAWYLLPGAFAVAIGVVGLLGLAPAGVGSLAIVAVGAVGILGGPVARVRGWPRELALLAIVGASFTGFVLAAWPAWRPRWLVGLVLVGLVALGVYGAHRYAHAIRLTREVQPEP